MESYKRSCYQLRLLLFSNSVDLKNNNRSYRKPFLLSGCAKAAIHFFMSILINLEIAFYTVMKRHLRHVAPLLKKQGEILP